MSRKRRKHRSKSPKKEAVSRLAENVPNVELQGQVKFDSEITTEDFKAINDGATAEIDEETVKKQKAMEEISNDTIKARKHSEITSINTEIINDIENGNAEKYFSAEVINRDGTNSDLMELLHRLADEKNANAQHILGVCYLTGTNVAIDEQKAVDYLTKASEQDHTAAQRNLAIALENQSSTDKNKIISLYEKAAAKDDAYALNNLAVCYLLGDGIRQNVKQAVKHFEKAVKLGDDYAMVNLADCYAIGNGVTKNDKKAFELYKQAAEKNNVDGIRNMADCLLNGIGTKQDFKLAMEMYKKAADFGDIKAAEKYNELSEKLSPQKHSEATISNNENKSKKEEKPTLEQAFDLGKKAQENKEKDKDEKADAERDIAPPEKKKEAVSL